MYIQMQPPLLHLHELSLTIPQLPYPLIDTLSLTLNEGETLALIIQHPFGFEWMTRALLFPPSGTTQGEARFRGQDLLTLTESSLQRLRGDHIAIVPLFTPDPLPPFPTVGRQLHDLLQTHRSLDASQRQARLLAILDEVEAPDPAHLLTCYPEQLSEETLQKILIARALLTDPDLLIIGLMGEAAETSYAASIACLYKIQKKKQRTLLLLTHDIRRVATLADLSFILYRGTVVERGRTVALLDHPSHPYTQMQLAACQQGAFPSDDACTQPSLPSGCPFRSHCPYAMTLCQRESPPLFPLPTDAAHLSRCWLLDKELEWKMEDAYRITN